MAGTVSVKKMTVAIDINSNTVRAINGRLSDMDVSDRGRNKLTDGRMNDDNDGGSGGYTYEQVSRV